MLTLGLPAKAPSQNQAKYHRSDEQQSLIYNDMKVFLDEFLPECHQQMTDLIAGEIPAPHVPIRRADHWILDPAFVKLVAGCYQLWKSSDDDTAPLSEHLRTAVRFERSIGRSKADMEELGLVDNNGARVKPIRKTSPVWKEAAVKICHAARDSTN